MSPVLGVVVDGWALVSWKVVFAPGGDGALRHTWLCTHCGRALRREDPDPPAPCRHRSAV